jgi:AcrR family transcriptional regulator
MTNVGTDDENRPGARRPGGRTERTRRAVAQAVLDLLAEGTSVINVSEVAKRAGVHRSTLHRRWPTRASLVEEALTLHTSHIKVPDSGNFADDLFALAHTLAAFFADPTEVGTNIALATHIDREADDATLRYWLSLSVDLARPFHRAIARGDVQADANPLVLLNLLVGPLVIWPLLLTGAPEPWFVDEFALAVIRAAKPAPAVEARALELAGQRRVTVALPWWSPPEGAASDGDAQSRD